MNMHKPKNTPRHMKRPNFSKGGMIKKIAGRHYFDDGGSTTLTSPASSVDGQPAATVSNNGITGTIGNILGLNNQFQGQAASISGGTNTAQLNDAYSGAQSGLTQQQQLAGEVAGGGAQGVNTQNALTGQLEGVVNGTGPNAAQAALNQNTATNVANTASLMAGQRGANANPGLIAREAAQQGAATQQAAVGQGATLQAQQQIAAQGQLANLASTQVGQQAGAVQGVNQTQQNEQNILQGANTAANNANVGMQSNLNNVNSQTAAANQNQSSNIVNGISSAGSSALSGITSMLAKGGEVDDHHCAGSKCTDRAHYAHMMADGGPLSITPATPAQGIGPWVNSQPDTSSASVPASSPLPPTVPLEIGPQDSSDKGGGGGAGIAGLAALMSKGGNVEQGPHGHVAAYLSGGGKVPAMVSPGEKYLNPTDVEKVIREGANPLKMGRTIPGKAKIKGDSLKNDTVPADLEEGGVILPRHIMSKKNRDHAELFVRRAVHMHAPKGGK